MRSVHDNHVVGYSVDPVARRILLHTRSDAARAEETDVIFDGVLAYHFQGDNFATVLFSVDEESLESTVESARDLFIRGVEHMWPGPWNESPEIALRYLRSEGAKAFRVSASYGMTGWVIARSLHVEASAGKKAV